MSQLNLPKFGCKSCCRQSPSPHITLPVSSLRLAGFVREPSVFVGAFPRLCPERHLKRSLTHSRRCNRLQALKRERISSVTRDAESSTAEAPWETTNQALTVLGGFAGVLLLGQVLADVKAPFADLPYFVSLATLTIYIAAHRSRSNKTRQQITLTQGAWAPVTASGALLGGYLVIKYFQQAPLQLIFNCYFWLLGSVAVAGTLQPPLNRLVEAAGLQDAKFYPPRGLIKVDNDDKDLADVGVSIGDVVALALGVLAASADLLAGHTNFTLNNLLACLIAIDILGLIGLSSFRVALVLLGGLLFYDVFWVFGSPKVIGDNVMLAVATSNILTGPVRLLFPRPAGIGEARNFPFALLGLGDIAVPGLLAGLALRFDAFRRQPELPVALPEPSLLQRLQQQVKSLTAAPARPEAPAALVTGESDSADIYFWACMAAYLAGLGAAFLASTITKLGQPALLYIVPFMLAAVGGVAISQGELSKVIEYKEAPTDSPFSALSDKSDE